MSVPRQIARVLLKNGFTPKAAAGIIGNAYCESGYKTTADDGAGNGGLWGFTTHPISKQDMINWTTSHGMDWKNPKAQTKFLLQHITPELKQQLNKSKS